MQHQKEKASFDHFGARMPLFGTIREVVRLGIASENYLRAHEADGKLPGYYSGRTKMVNVRQLIAQLDAESKEGRR